MPSLVFKNEHGREIEVRVEAVTEGTATCRILIANNETTWECLVTAQEAAVIHSLLGAHLEIAPSTEAVAAPSRQPDARNADEENPSTARDLQERLKAEVASMLQMLQQPADWDHLSAMCTETHREAASILFGINNPSYRDAILRNKPFAEIKEIPPAYTLALVSESALTFLMTRRAACLGYFPGWQHVVTPIYETRVPQSVEDPQVGSFRNFNVGVFCKRMLLPTGLGREKLQEFDRLFPRRLDCIHQIVEILSDEIGLNAWLAVLAMVRHAFDADDARACRALLEAARTKVPTAFLHAGDAMYGVSEDRTRTHPLHRGSLSGPMALVFAELCPAELLEYTKPQNDKDSCDFGWTKWTREDATAVARKCPAIVETVIEGIKKHIERAQTWKLARGAKDHEAQSRHEHELFVNLFC